MLIMIDGPENSGKTVVVEAVKKILEKSFWAPVEIVKQSGRALPNEDVYLYGFYEALSLRHKFVIWDRGWPSEFTYGRILNQGRPIAKDPFIGFWKFDRVMRMEGMGTILSGNNCDLMDEMRDETDIDTSADLERSLFEDYAVTFGLRIIRNKMRGMAEVNMIAKKIVTRVFRSCGSFKDLQMFPHIVGHPNAMECFVEANYDSNNGIMIPFKDDMELFRQNYRPSTLIRSAYANFPRDKFFEEQWGYLMPYEKIHTFDPEIFEFLAKRTMNVFLHKGEGK